MRSDADFGRGLELQRTLLLGHYDPWLVGCAGDREGVLAAGALNVIQGAPDDRDQESFAPVVIFLVPR